MQRTQAHTASGGVLGTRARVVEVRHHTTQARHAVDRSLVASGTPLFPVRAHELERLAGTYAVAHGVRVLSVVGPRIFWVGPSISARLLVHLQGRGTRYAIRPGQRLDFTGVVTRNPIRAAVAWGLTWSEGRGLLRAEQLHVEVFGPRIRFR
jgi:hypothetical protein